jgi:hypothetical protein
VIDSPQIDKMQYLLKELCDRVKNKFNKGLQPVHDRILLEQVESEQLEEFASQFYQTLVFHDPNFRFQFQPLDLAYLEEFDQYIANL